MRILVAYDASPGAADALSDLARAGLPESADALVLAVAPESGACPGDASSAASFGRSGGSYARRDPVRLAVEHARTVAARGERDLRCAFPHWTVAHDAITGRAAESIAESARRWGADLVVTGSHAARGASGIPALGSVARRLVEEAPCSVRVGRRAAREASRPAADAPVVLLVGYDASPGADAAVTAAGRRRWPVGSTARVVVVVDPQLAHAGGDEGSGGVPWKWLRDRASAAAALLRDAGLRADADVVTGEPRRMLVDEAARCAADVVFVGALGLGGGAPKLVGGAAAAVAAAAPCTVEVVRLPAGSSATHGSSAT